MKTWEEDFEEIVAEYETGWVWEEKIKEFIRTQIALAEKRGIDNAEGKGCYYCGGGGL